MGVGTPDDVNVASISTESGVDAKPIQSQERYVCTESDDKPVPSTMLFRWAMVTGALD